MAQLFMIRAAHRRVEASREMLRANAEAHAFSAVMTTEGGRGLRELMNRLEAIATKYERQ